MQTISPGTKVRFIGKASWASNCEIIGTVLHIYPGDTGRDEHGRKYRIEEAACVSVHSVPDRWPYPGTSKFAPALSELEVVE